MTCSAARQFFNTCVRRAGIVLLAAGSAAALLAFFAWADEQPILIQSRESKTAAGGPVFNRIHYQPAPDRDTWIMQQSHFGPDAPAAQWDRIAITVTHGARRTAMFTQHAPGALALHPDEPEVEKKARCYMCHANGPRAIRPEWDSAEAKVSAWDRLRLALWNIRIKTYGKFTPTPQDKSPDYRVQSALADEPLRVAACTRCHDKDAATGLHGLVARGTLRRQHYAAIDFMVENGLMPPPGYDLTVEEKREVRQFTGRLAASPSVGVSQQEIKH